MATRTQRINPQGVDKRVKLTESDKADSKGTSQRELARAFGVSRRLVSFIIYPERLALVKAQYKERSYYIKEAHTKAVQNYRTHLREVHPELSEGDTIRRLNAERATRRKAKMGNRIE